MFTFAVASCLVITPVVEACSNVVWKSNHGTVITRTMDWMDATHPTLKTYRAGDTRNLHGVDSGDTYTVDIDFLAVESFGLVTEGVNESGFQMSVQFYRDMALDDAQKNNLAQLELAAYLLGSAHTVEKALAMVKQLKVGMVPLPALAEAPVGHYIMTDKSGDRALLQYDQEGLKIYRGEDARVVTNNPSQAVHLKQWKEKKAEIAASGGFDSTINLEAGNTQSTQRSVFSNYFVDQLKTSLSPIHAMMAVEGTTFKVPQQAAYKLGGKMTTYATEYSITYNLDSGDVVFKYTYGSNWNQQGWNYKTILASDATVERALYQ